MLLSRIAKNLLKTRNLSSKDASNILQRCMSVTAKIDEHQGNIEVKEGDDYLEFRCENGTSNLYPYIFLRDNCQCEKCFHPSTKQRLLNTTFDVPLDIKPEEVRNEDGVVTLKWIDGHVSVFPHNWLMDRAFPQTEAEIKCRSKCDLNAEFWDFNLQNNIPQHEYSDVISDENATLNWLESIATTGLTLIKNAPSRQGVLFDEIRKKAGGFVRKTHYGEIFHVLQKPGPNNLAYTASYLPLHVDLPFYDYQPGIQLLHCIQQASGVGGENHFVDGFNVAAQLKEADPEAFEILSSVKFTFNDIGSDDYGDFDKVFERPIIGLDGYGNVESISLNNHVRSSFVNAPAEKVYNCYKAYFSLVKAMYDPKNLVTHKMEAGDIITFNNQRVLHGRAAYSLTSSRFLEGCYFDWDEIYSSIRCLKRRLGNH